MAETAGVISKLNGTVTVERDGETVILREGDTVLEGDKIATKGTDVQIMLEDGSALTLDGYSEATISEAPSAGGGKTTIVVTVGTATYQSSTSVDSNPDDVLIITPDATIAVGDASVSIELSDNGELNVTNLANESGDYGTVIVSNESGEVKLDSENTTSTVTSSNEAPSAPEPAQEVRIEAVAEAVENIFDPEDDAPTSNANEESAVANETFVPPPAEVIVTELEPVFTPDPIVEDFGLSNDDFVFVEPDPEPVNTAPRASDIELTMEEDGGVIITEAQLLANVVDIEGDASIVSVTGAIDNNDGTFTLTPETDFNGTITLNYTVSDGQFTDTAKIIIEVLPVNDIPVLVPITENIDEDGSILVTQDILLEGASDIDGDDLTASNLSASDGTLVDNNNGTWTFTPDANFNGSIDFTFNVSDGTTTVQNTLTLDVTEVNDAPEVTGVTSSTNEDTSLLITQDILLEGATDIEGDNLTATNLAASTGTLVDNGNGTWTFTPDANFNGDVNFTFGVSDGTTTVANTLVLSVSEVNDAPEVANVEFTMDEDTSLTFTSAQLLANATDVDNDNLTIISVAGAVDNGNGTWTFTPDENFFGEVSLGFTVSDGTTTTDGTAVVTVNDVAEPPVNNDIVGTEDNDELKGTDGDDVIRGLGGDDELKGEKGDDELFGGDGDDELKGGDGDDTLDGGEGDDELKGEKGDDILDGGAGDDELKGGDGDDKLTGGAGDDELKGEKGDDELSGGSGADKLKGGKGDDILRGGSGDDDLKGEDGDDQIYVNEGNDKVDGGKGTDTVFFTGNRADYSISVDGDKITIIDGVDDRDGSNEIKKVESFTFADETVDLDTLLAEDLGYSVDNGEITFTGSDLDFDIDDFDEEPITKIDITGSGNNQLKVKAKDVKDAGGEITITGNAGDTIDLKGKWDEGDAIVIDGIDFTTYEGKDATIFIMDDLSII